MQTYDIETTPWCDAWVPSLTDLTGRRRILARIERLSCGNAGDSRRLHAGVSEVRLQCGPGYRIYVTLRGHRLLVLPGGGDKSTQVRDIARAMPLAQSLGSLK